MRGLTRGLGRTGAVAGVASAMTVLLATSAYADHTQYVYCNFDETGAAEWREPEDRDGFLSVDFIWRSVHNELAEQESGTYSMNGPGRIRAIGRGNEHWAPYAMRLNWPSSSHRPGATGCQSNPEAALNSTIPGESPVTTGAPLPGFVVSVDPGQTLAPFIQDPPIG